MTKLCEICESNKSVRNYKNSGKYLCGKHAYQLKTHGKIFERTIYDDNEFIEHEDVVLICIYNKHCIEIARAIIDKNKIHIAKQYKWYLHSSGYVCNKTGGSITYLHRLLMNAPKDKYVDHINMNKLDNRCLNLRLCTNAENMSNKQEIHRNYSGFRGVTWNKDIKKWVASLTVLREVKHLGYYDLFNDAVNARLTGERKYYKEFAPQDSIINENNVVITEKDFLKLTN